MEKRRITERQEEIYRTVSGEFKGLRVCDAAKALGVTTRAINRTLARMKLVAPELFPILNADEATLLEMLKRKIGPSDIAEFMGIGIAKVYRLKRKLIKKKRWSKETMKLCFATDILKNL
jgi:DNA-binding CsgD family transcriptional regulator